MLVLWIVALLTIIAIGMTSVQRTESTLAANQLAGARFRALADAAIHFTALNLMAQLPIELAQDDRDAQDLWLPDGSTNSWNFAGDRLEIAVFDEASLIDLNQAPNELLGDLLSAVGVGEEEQTALIDAILDWRDTDDLHQLNGAEDPDYESAGLPYGAKDGSFHSEEELVQVLGFDMQLFRTLAPALTVSAVRGGTVTSGQSLNAGQAGVNLELAPPLVRAAMEGIRIEELEERLELEADADIVGNGLPVLDRGGPVYRMRISQESADGATRSMVALVRVQNGATPPVAILWRRFALSREPASSETDDQEEEE